MMEARELTLEELHQSHRREINKLRKESLTALEESDTEATKEVATLHEMLEKAEADLTKSQEEANGLRHILGRQFKRAEKAEARAKELEEENKKLRGKVNKANVNIASFERSVMSGSGSLCEMSDDACRELVEALTLFRSTLKVDTEDSKGKP